MKRLLMALVLCACGDEGAQRATDTGSETGADTSSETRADADADTLTDADIDVDVRVDVDADTDADEVTAIDADTSVEVDDTLATEVTDDTTLEVDDIALDIADDTTLDVADDTTLDVEAEVTPTPIAAPLVSYGAFGTRVLLFENNPEQLMVGDLGDSTLGDVTLLRATVTGYARSFYEHVNRTGRTIGYGVQIYNPGSASVTVTTAKIGFEASILGGAPFATVLQGGTDSSVQTLPPGGSTWIVRRDEAVPNGTFFSGVVDYRVVGGNVIVNHVAYDTFAGLDGSTSELGYVQRVEPDGTDEARMYKGRMSATEIGTELAWEVDDTAPAGPLPVNVMRYDLATASFAEPIVATSWVTHIGPAQNALSTVSDMATITLPGWTFSALAPSDARAKHANLGNWGVVYVARLRLTNSGTQARTITLRITASPGAGAGLAYRDGTTWKAARLERGDMLDIGTLTVDPGLTLDLETRWVLGGPSGGGIRHEAILD